MTLPIALLPARIGHACAELVGRVGESGLIRGGCRPGCPAVGGHLVGDTAPASSPGQRERERIVRRDVRRVVAAGIDKVRKRERAGHGNRSTVTVSALVSRYCRRRPPRPRGSDRFRRRDRTGSPSWRSRSRRCRGYLIRDDRARFLAAQHRSNTLSAVMSGASSLPLSIRLANARVPASRRNGVDDDFDHVAERDVAGLVRVDGSGSDRCRRRGPAIADTK